MGFNSFIKFMLPKDSKFLSLLRSQTDDVVEGAGLLVEFVGAPDHEARKEVYMKIKQVETHCDQITDEIFNELNRTFITPFDREDIHTLASQLDDVLDMINASAKRTMLYKPKEMGESMSVMANHIKEMAGSLQIAVCELDKLNNKKRATIRIQCRRLHELENSADDVYERFIISLFGHEKNAIEMLKQVEIIQLLESTTDRAYRVVDVLKTIMVKYA